MNENVVCKNCGTQYQVRYSDCPGCPRPIPKDTDPGFVKELWQRRCQAKKRENAQRRKRAS